MNHHHHWHCPSEVSTRIARLKSPLYTSWSTATTGAVSSSVDSWAMISKMIETTSKDPMKKKHKSKLGAFWTSQRWDRRGVLQGPTEAVHRRYSDIRDSCTSRKHAGRRHARHDRMGKLSWQKPTCGIIRINVLACFLALGFEFGIWSFCNLKMECDREGA